MVDIKISGRKVSVSDALRDHVEVKVGEPSRYLTSSP